MTLVEEQVLMKMLADDTLTLKCDIDVFVGVKMTPTHQLQPLTTLTDDMLAYLSSDASHDTAVILAEGRSHTTANATLLAARSKVLRKLLLHDHHDPICAGPTKSTDTSAVEGSTVPSTPEDEDTPVAAAESTTVAPSRKARTLVLDDVTAFAFNQLTAYLLHDT